MVHRICCLIYRASPRCDWPSDFVTVRRPLVMSGERSSGWSRCPTTISAESSTPSPITVAAAQLAYGRSNNAGARRLFNEALPLYRGIGDSYSLAFCHASLAGVASSPDERQDHCDKALGYAERSGIPHLVPTLREIGGCA